MLSISAARALCALFSALALLWALPALATLTTSEQGRFYLYVLDSNGNPTDAGDDIEVRPHSDLGAGAAIDATYLGGVSSTWYWSIDWFDDEEVYRLYVNGVAQQDSLPMENTVENSIPAAAIRDDAVTASKLDSDGAFQLDPASSSAALKIDFDTSDPVNGSALEVDFGGQIQTGLSFGTMTVSGQTGLSGSVGGSANADVISITNASSGATSRGIYVSTSSGGAASAGVGVANTGTGVGLRVQNLGTGDDPIGIGISNSASGATIPYGLYCDTGLGGRGIWSRSNELALGVEGFDDADTTLFIKRGQVIYDDDGTTPTTNALKFDQWSGTVGAIAIDMSGTAGGLKGSYTNMTHATSAQTGHEVNLGSGTGASTGFYATSGGDDARGFRYWTNSTGLGLSLQRGTATLPAEANRQLAIIQQHASADGSEALRVENNGTGNSIVIDSGVSTLSETTALGTYTLMNGDNTAYAIGHRIGIGGTTPAAVGTQAEMSTGYTGSVHKVVHNGTSDGHVLEIDFADAPGKEYTGDGMIELVESSSNFTLKGPLIHVDTATNLPATEGVIDLKGTSGGPLILLESTGTAAIDVTDGYVWMDEATQVSIPSSATPPTFPQDGAIYFETDDQEWNVYYSGSWYAVAMTTSAQAKQGPVYADTLVHEFLVDENWKGTGVSDVNSNGWPLIRITKADGNFGVTHHVVTPAFESRDSLIVDLFLSSGAGSPADQVLTFSLAPRGMGEFGSTTYAESITDTITMGGSQYFPVKHTVRFGNFSPASTDELYYLKVLREDNNAADTDTGDTFIHGGRSHIF